MKSLRLRLIHLRWLLTVTLASAASQPAWAAVTFGVSPATVSNTYSGNITLSISNLNAVEAVVVQKFIDLNTNGVIDAGEWLMQQYRLTDGQPGMVISGVTNINVPGDSTSADGTVISVQSFL